MAACGLLRDGVSVFHLLSHATLKAGLFLGAGVVLMGADSRSTGLGGGQDVRQGGGFGSGVSGGALCWGAMLVSSLGLSGFPGLTGASSKDSILQAGVWSLDCGSFAVPMLAGSVCATGAYLARLLWGAHLATFGGRLAATPHESSAQSVAGASPAIAWVPILVLAAGDILAAGQVSPADAGCDVGIAFTGAMLFLGAHAGRGPLP